MSKKPEDPALTSAPQTPVDGSRRRFLGGVAVLGAGATFSGVVGAADAAMQAKPATNTVLTGPTLDKALQDNIKTIVVIYGENRSFNNLFAHFPGVEHPLSAVTASEYQQRDRDGKVLDTLPPCWEVSARSARRASTA
jgi:phospholipase C